MLGRTLFLGCHFLSGGLWPTGPRELTTDRLPQPSSNISKIWRRELLILELLPEEGWWSVGGVSMSLGLSLFRARRRKEGTTGNGVWVTSSQSSTERKIRELDSDVPSIGYLPSVEHEIISRVILLFLSLLLPCGRGPKTEPKGLHQP